MYIDTFIQDRVPWTCLTFIPIGYAYKILAYFGTELGWVQDHCLFLFLPPSPHAAPPGTGALFR
jgi:hypothetical protein